MPDATPKRSSPIQFLLLFLIAYLLSDYALKAFFPRQFNHQPEQKQVVLSMQHATVRQGNDPVAIITNGTDAAISLPVSCPQPPLTVFRVKEDGSTGEQLTATGSAVPCTDLTEPIAAGQKHLVNLAPWKYSLFWQPGMYELRLKANLSATGSGVARTATGGVLAARGASASGAAVVQNPLHTQFQVYEPGVFAKLFRTFITKPFLNFLILVASALPDHNLGVAIIVLTLLVKLLLFFPTQHALEGQKKMQKIQPKMEEIKQKYKGNAAKIQEETMKLWKESGVNPWQSCLPTLVQFPVLIGLFYVIRTGSNLALSKHLVYPFYQHLTWNFGTHFLGLDLLHPNIWIMPALLVFLQFLQMRLTFAIAARKKRQSVIDVPSAKELEREVKNASTDPEAAQKLQQNIMMYGLPIMIGVMALQFPAAVSLYWATQALFGIGQQALVNRRTA